MTDSSRLILSRIRGSQFGGGDADVIAAELQALGRAPLVQVDEEERLETFLRRLAINNISLQVAPSRSDAVKHIAKFIYTEHNTHRAVAGNDRRLAALPWRDGGVLVRFGAAVAEDPVSVSFARFAVAETGSLVLYTNRDNPAANNWLVQDHIVLVDERDLLSHLDDAWAKIRDDIAQQGTPRGVCFISGPSSTGDIAGHMVTGAHGPQRLHLVYLGRIPEELLLKTGHLSTPQS